MNKKELVRSVSKQTLYDSREVEAIVDSVLETMSTTLQGGEKVQLVGFGLFEIKAREGHSGINPRTKKPINIPARRALVFKASKKLKEYVNADE